MDYIICSYLIRINQLELPVFPRPLYDVPPSWIGEELQQELPELDRTGALVPAGPGVLGGVRGARGDILPLKL